MSIEFNNNNKIFSLKTKNTSYILRVLESGHLGHLYWGRKLNNYNIEYVHKRKDLGSFLATTDNIIDFHLEATPQEYPSYGATDLRSPAIELQFLDGSTVSDFRYESHKIFKGKNKIKGLPAVYIEDENEADTLEIVLRDSLKDIKILLIYSVFGDFDVITRSAKILNSSKENVILNRALSMNVDFNHSKFDLIQLSGSWGRERQIIRREVNRGTQSVESRRGSSSHAQNPFISLVGKDTNDHNGEAYGFSLVYSGNFLANTEVDMHGNTRVQLGINPFNFSWLLEPGEEFNTPEAVLVYSDNGLNGMSSIYHNIYGKRLCRGTYRDKERPILINNWEATYFDFNEKIIKDIAREASNLGIELFVLDDGWFGERNDDTSSLGDWYVNEEKIKGGLNKLATEINDMGIKFGLWFEPEMVSPNSKLYKEHPDWCIHIEGRTRSQARKQLILDFSRDEVCDEVIKRVSDILSSAPISYVKWDMNRNMTEVGSPAWPAERQKEVAHRYMLGLYRVLEAITSKFENVLFESCSGGGGRFDPGILYYMPQTWTSDNTDAIERLKIQFGTSLVYPPISMGCHVSASPNHQVERSTPINTRAVVAMAGNYGYELNITNLSDEEKSEVRNQIKLYKEIRNTVQFGDFYRIQSPFEDNHVAWMVMSKDKKEIIVSYVRINAEVNTLQRPLKLKYLDENARYKIIESNKIYGGDELMYIGLEVPDFNGDFKSKLWRIEKV